MIKLSEMKNIILIATFLLCSITAVFAKSDNWLDGEWNGTGYQIDGKTWTVELAKQADRLTIQYPSLGCGGNWKIIKSSKDRIELEETIVEGAEKCDQGCKIVLFKINENQLSVIYFLPSYQKDAIASLVLTKK